MFTRQVSIQIENKPPHARLGKGMGAEESNNNRCTKTSFAPIPLPISPCFKFIKLHLGAIGLVWLPDWCNRTNTIEDVVGESETSTISRCSIRLAIFDNLPKDIGLGSWQRQAFRRLFWMDVVMLAPSAVGEIGLRHLHQSTCGVLCIVVIVLRAAPTRVPVMGSPR